MKKIILIVTAVCAVAGLAVLGYVMSVRRYEM